MSQTISACLKKGVQFLRSAGVPEAAISAKELLSHVLKRPRLSLDLDSETQIDSQREDEFESLLAKRATRYPLQYLVRTVGFRDALLEVGEGCLIPRPETEVLVDAALCELGRASERVNLLDVGTGSGNVAVSLAKERPNWLVTATDISPDALRYAKLNADRNGVHGQIHFVQTDLWQGVDNCFFDAIVSNPPYLTRLELTQLQPEVVFEPSAALDGGTDGLLFYKRIIQNAKSVLKLGGFVFFEMGMGQPPSISKILEANYFGSIRILQDASGIERIISARLVNHG